jgi:hypothetical protein
MRRTVLTFVLGALVSQGCGSGTDSQGNGGANGGGSKGDTAPAGGSGGSAGTTVGTSSCDKDLTGTWDLLATGVGAGPASGIMILGADGFTVTTDGGQLAYTAKGTKSATWTTTGSKRIIGVQNTPASLNAGSIPVALGGHWVFSSTFETCALDVAASNIVGRCNGRPDEFSVGGDDWPYAIPNLQNGLTYSITRTSTTTSQFGDLGGTWMANSSTGSGQYCIITLAGNTMTADCRTQTEFSGITHLTIGSDCVASGTTPGGLELSARKR